MFAGSWENRDTGIPFVAPGRKRFSETMLSKN